MPIITSKNREEWMQAEMARRSGKPAPKPQNMYAGMEKSELKQHKIMLKEAKKEAKSAKE
jgi:hypothetical protein